MIAPDASIGKWEWIAPQGGAWLRHSELRSSPIRQWNHGAAQFRSRQRQAEIRSRRSSPQGSSFLWAPNFPATSRRRSRWTGTT